MNIIVKIAESELKQDKNGNSYKTVTFSEQRMVDTPFGKMALPTSQSRSTKINRYAKSYLNGEPEIGFNDPIFNSSNPTKGGWFMGAIETRKVNEYDITADDGSVRTVDTYTTIVFGDSDNPAFESLVKSSFKSRGHEIADQQSATPTPSLSVLERLRESVEG